MTRKYFGQIFVQIVFHLCKGGRVGPLPQVVANRSGQLSHWKQKLKKNWVLNFFGDKWKWYPHDGYPWWKWVKQGCRLVNCSLVKAPDQIGMKSHLKESNKVLKWLSWIQIWSLFMLIMLWEKMFESFEPQVSDTFIKTKKSFETYRL